MGNRSGRARDAGTEGGAGASPLPGGADGTREQRGRTRSATSSRGRGALPAAAVRARRPVSLATPAPAPRPAPGVCVAWASRHARWCLVSCVEGVLAFLGGGFVRCEVLGTAARSTTTMTIPPPLVAPRSACPPSVSWRAGITRRGGGESGEARTHGQVVPRGRWCRGPARCRRDAPHGLCSAVAQAGGPTADHTRATRSH